MKYVLGSALILATVLRVHAQAPLTIENDRLSATWNPGAGRLTMTVKATGRVFLSNAKLHGNGSAMVKSINDPVFGVGRAIEISDANGNRDSVMVFPKLPFALLRSTVHNSGAETSITPKWDAVSAVVNLEKPAAQLKTFGTGGLLTADQNPGSYVWLAVVEPESRNGVVFGWLTENRGSGVVFSKVAADAVQVDARIDYGKLRLDSGATEELETLAIGYFDDARLGLEQWADAVARFYDIHLPPQPTGYCTWYSQPHGGAADQEHLAQLAAFAATNLAPFGFSVVQIDDKWQAGWKRTSPSSPKKNFTTNDPDGPYPSGMKAAADQLKSLGLVPGIWFMPFAGTVGDPYFDAHLEWFAKTPDGKPYDTPWGGTCLDMTEPGARAHLRDVVSRICGDWGFQYLKIDGLWTGTATKQLYVNSGYKEDDIGDAVFHDPKKTNIEIYRDGLKLVREAAGKNVFILGCNAPQNMRSYGGAFGLVNAMRIGPDNKADWKSLLRGPTFGSRHYFLNRRVWYNDPDPVYVRANIPLNHAQLICSWVALSGQLNLSSEWLPGLPAERLDILKRTMPYHHAVARPVDLFENELPRIWTVTAPDREVIGLYNWDSKPVRFDVPLEKMGLSGNQDYVAFDFWGNKFLPSIRGRLLLEIPGESCVVLSIRPNVNHPQVISTSRHVTQGMIELREERWEAQKRSLSGCLQVQGGDPSELRIAIRDNPDGYLLELSRDDQAAGVMVQPVSSSEGLLRFRIQSPSSREVVWAVAKK